MRPDVSDLIAKLGIHHRLFLWHRDRLESEPWHIARFHGEDAEYHCGLRDEAIRALNERILTGISPDPYIRGIDRNAEVEAFLGIAAVAEPAPRHAAE